VSREICLRNLTPWKRGQSGNPSGRPKGLVALIRDALERDILQGVKTPDGRSIAEHYAEAVIGHGMKGNAPYMTQVMDRLEGKIGTASTESGDEAGGLRPIFEIILNDRDKPGASVQPPAGPEALP
jgi:hypothetical protein